MPKPVPNPARRTRARLLLRLLIGAIKGRWRRYEIADHSMRPTFDEGDWVLGVTRPQRLRVGDVVVCDLPSRTGFAIVKRVASIDPTDGSLWLLGDDPSAGTVDSRSFGTVAAAAITTQLAIRFWPFPPKLIHHHDCSDP